MVLFLVWINYDNPVCMLYYIVLYTVVSIAVFKYAV